VPEMDVVAVFTGWNIDGIPALDPRFALDAVLEAAGAPLIATSQHE